MNIIQPTVEVWRQEPGVEGLYRHIERCARICYRSENKGNMTSEEFVKKVLMKREHGRPLEFGTVTMRINCDDPDCMDIRRLSFASPWVIERNGHIITNLRLLIERFPDKWQHMLTHYLEVDRPTIDPNVYRPTFHWHISRGIADEFRTHVTLSSLCESTRYVNYDKKGMDFMLPRWAKGLHFEDCYRPAEDSKDMRLYVWMRHNQRTEEDYLELLRLGLKPENTRGVLNFDIATHLVQCGFDIHWENFFDKRLAADAHPDARYIAKKAKKISKFDFYEGLSNNKTE